jgi:hypothetical protein
MLFMFDLGSLLRAPFIFLILSVLAISAATVFACTGRVWVRFSGWVYRAKEPRVFWVDVIILYLAGVFFMGCFLFGGPSN